MINLILLSPILISLVSMNAMPHLDSNFQPSTGIEYVPGQLIITLKQESAFPNAREISTFHSRMSDALPDYLDMRKWDSPKANISVINVDPSEEENYITMLKNNPNVASVERDQIVHARGHVTASDPNFSDQTPNYNAITILDAWHFTTGDPSIIVAVVDTGTDWNHIDLSANIWSNDDSCTGGVDNDANGFIDDCRGWDFVNSDNNPDDDNGHGTPVSGIIAAVRNNGIQGTGSAPNVTLMPLKVLDSGGSGFNSDIIAAMNYAVDNGARIINLSLGADGPCPASFQTALDNAFANNVLVVHAAGESGTNRIDVEDNIASCNNVISVTSTDDLNQSTSYDDWVDSIDLAAPGGDFANVDNPITLGISSTFLANTFDGLNFGTSFAAPHVSGCAALVYSVDPTLTFDEAESVLETTALDLTDSGKTINLATVGKDKVFGHGLVQCGAAVAFVSCLPPSSGDWIITSGCPLSNAAFAPANVMIQNIATLTIPSGLTLVIDSSNDLTVQSGSGLLIQSGGQLVFTDADVVNPLGTATPGCEDSASCFLPFSKSITTGTTVTWKNFDTAAHTFTSGTAADPGTVGDLFDSSLIFAGQSFSHQFNSPGTFDYFCLVHPWMVGQIIVT